MQNDRKRQLFVSRGWPQAVMVVFLFGSSGSVCPLPKPTRANCRFQAGSPTRHEECFSNAPISLTDNKLPCETGCGSTRFSVRAPTSGRTHGGYHPYPRPHFIRQTFAPDEVACKTASVVKHHGR
jgi:hypothetical protein